MCNKCIKFCPLFNIGVMLFMRFNITNELNNIDFMEDDWFDIKLIANLQSCSKFKYMKDRMQGAFYTDGLKKIEKILGIKLPAGLHFGRKMAVIILEILQTPLDIIKEFGLWNTDVYSEVYSQRLCIAGCKSISGYQKGDTSYYNEPSEIPEDNFEKTIWSNIDDLIIKAKEKKKPTAFSYLSCLVHFRRVLCQDLAYLKMTNEDHWLLHQFPFNTTEFETYTQKGKVVIQQTNINKSKNNNAIDLQGMNDFIAEQNNSMTKNIKKMMKESIDEVNCNLLNQSKIIKQEIAKNNKGVSYACQYIEFLSSFKPKNIECDSLTTNIPTKANEITLEEQFEKTTLGNVSWYTKNDAMPNENTPKIPKSFEKLQQVFEYFQSLKDYADGINKTVSQTFSLSLPNGVNSKSSTEGKNYKYARMIYK